MFCQKSKGCPQFDDETFEIMDLDQPALHIFSDLTTIYSTKAANLHRVLSNLEWAVSQSEKLENNPLLAEAGARPFKNAGAKMRKYFIRYFHHDCVCTAFALALDNRAPSLERILDAYGPQRRMPAIIKVIKEKPQ
jgi:hypothetical protein